MNRLRANGLLSRSVLASIVLGALLLSGALPLAAKQESSVLSISNQAVTSEFPTGLRFILKAETEKEVSRADLVFSAGANETLYQTTVRIPDASQVGIEHSLELQNLGIPPGLVLAYHWKLHTTSGVVLETPEQQVEWFDDRFSWTLYESEDILLYAYSGDDEFNEGAVTIAQEAVDDSQDRFDAPERPEPLRIWLYESQSDMGGALSPNSREWIGGISYANFSMMAAVVPAGDERAMLRVVPHEVVHQIFYDATRNPFNNPAAWLDEGLASSIQVVGLENFDEIVDEAYLDGTLPSLRSMISEWGSDRRSVQVSYASSYSVVTFIQDTMGDEAIDGLLEAYRQGLSHEAAMIQALGMTTDELDTMWRQYLDEAISS